MIDKLDLRIPHGSAFRPKVHEYTKGLPYESYTSRVRPSLHYTGKSDLRTLEIDAVLHLESTNGTHDHKLEILDAGTKTYSDLVELIDSVCELDADSLRIMRVDLAADVSDIPVSWFQRNARMKFKRFGREFGIPKYDCIARGEVETIMIGRRPNLIRIYNKIEEWKLQHRRKRSKAGANCSTFEATFGYAQDATLTRVERQITSRMHEAISTFGLLVKNGPDFDPFSNLSFVDASKCLRTAQDSTGIEFYTGIGLQAECARLGFHNFRRELNRKTNGNAARTIERYAAFLSEGSRPLLTSEALFENYSQSIRKQLAA